MPRGEGSNREDAPVVIREGYQGEPLPSGTRPVPPKGAAADVPAKEKEAAK